MKKLAVRVALLALLLGAVVLLCSLSLRGTDAGNGEATGVVREFPGAASKAGPSAPSMDVLRAGDGVTLGKIAENPAGEGITVTVTGENGAETVYTFTDVAINSWYANAVNFVVSAGLMTGVGDQNIFRPEYGMQRESFAAILYRYANGTQAEPGRSFDDVTPDRWYYDAVNWAVSRRLMSGLTENSFGAGEYMTCEQALICLYRLAGEPETDGDLSHYPYEAKVPESSRSAVSWAWQNGLITEVECVWYPTQAISRAQVALLLTRYSAGSM